MDDELLRALGRRQRASEGPDAMSPHDSHAAALEDLLRPLDDTEAQAVLDGAFARLRERRADDEDEGRSAQAPVRAPEPPQAAPGPDADVPANVATYRSWRAPLAAVVAIAAAVVLWLGLRPGEGELLPPYEVVLLQGGPATMRGDTPPRAEALRMPADGVIDWRLSPQRTIDRDVGVALLARHDDGSVAFARPEGVEVSAAGAIRLRGALDRFLSLGPGHWTVEVIVAPAAEVPADADAALAGDEAWQRIPVEVTITAP